MNASIERPPRPPRPSVDLSAPLTDLNTALLLADVIAQSTVGVPEALRGKPGNVLILLMTGAELGLSWPQSLRGIYVTRNGMPGLKGELLLVKIREAGHDYDFKETKDGCWFRLHRGHEGPIPDSEHPEVFDMPCTKGRDYVTSFTLDDALAARLVFRRDDGTIVARSSQGNPLPWEQYRSDMLYWRAAARACRRFCPEVTFGFNVPGAETTLDGDDGGGGGGPAAQPIPGSPTIRGTAEDVPSPEQVRDELAAIDAAATTPGDEPGPPAAPVPDDPPPPASDPPGAAEEEPPGQVDEPGDDDSPPVSDAERRKLATKLADFGIDPDERRETAEAFTGHPVASLKELTADEAARLMTALTGIMTEASEISAHPPDLLIDYRQEWRREKARKGKPQ